jgi:hypothetical protein
MGDFRSGFAGLVRMELGAGFVQNSFLRIPIGQICPANVPKQNHIAKVSLWKRS